MSLFAIDIPGVLLGALIGGAVGALAYGVDRGVRACWRWLRRPKQEDRPS